MDIYLKILPVYVVMALGVLGRRLGFLPAAYIGPANRLIYYFAIPVLVFLKVSKAPFRQAFQVQSGLLMMGSFILIGLLAVTLSRFLFADLNGNGLRASFIQAGTHGNLGYVGIAIIYYVFGDEGLAAGGFVMAQLILLQNVFSVIVLTRYGNAAATSTPSAWLLLKPVLTNPIIISLVLAVMVSILNWRLPQFLTVSMEMISDMALPTALLIIGASLSFAVFSETVRLMCVSTFLKLVILPAVGSLILWVGGAPPMIRAVVTVLLAAPTATVVVVMGGELGGDPKWSANVVSLTTLCSAGTYYAWLAFILN